MFFNIIFSHKSVSFINILKGLEKSEFKQIKDKIPERSLN